MSSTPGSWRVEEHHSGYRILADDPRSTIIASGIGPLSNLQARDDAFLIAAAPALLEVLQKLDECYCEANESMSKQTRDRHRRVLIDDRAAIAAATGETK